MNSEREKKENRKIMAASGVAIAGAAVMVGLLGSLLEEEKIKYHQDY